MIPFHEFFYKRANEIINQQKSKFENEDCFLFLEDLTLQKFKPS